MIGEQFGYLAIFISLFGIFFYLKDTLSGKTKPNRVSWLIWMLAPFVGAFLQWESGAGLSALVIFMSGFISLLVLIVSFFNKEAYWKITILDIICGILAIFALVFWVLTKNSFISLLFAILADFLGAMPTLIKSWKFPETETGFEYICSIFNSILGLLVIKNWIFPIYSFGVYLLIMNFLFVFFIYRKKYGV